MLELVDSLDAPETKAGDETEPFEATYFPPKAESMDTLGTVRPPDAHPGVAPDPTPVARAEAYSPLGTTRGFSAVGGLSPKRKRPLLRTERKVFFCAYYNPIPFP